MIITEETVDNCHDDTTQMEESVQNRSRHVCDSSQTEPVCDQVNAVQTDLCCTRNKTTQTNKANNKNAQINHKWST